MHRREHLNHSLWVLAFSVFARPNYDGRSHSDRIALYVTFVYNSIHIRIVYIYDTRRTRFKHMNSFSVRRYYCSASKYIDLCLRHFYISTRKMKTKASIPYSVIFFNSSRNFICIFIIPSFFSKAAIEKELTSLTLWVSYTFCFLFLFLSFRCFHVD